jgi:hypothetical protein
MWTTVLAVWNLIFSWLGGDVDLMEKGKGERERGKRRKKNGSVRSYSGRSRAWMAVATAGCAPRVARGMEVGVDIVVKVRGAVLMACRRSRAVEKSGIVLVEKT